MVSGWRVLEVTGIPMTARVLRIQGIDRHAPMVRCASGRGSPVVLYRQALWGPVLDRLVVSDRPLVLQRRDCALIFHRCLGLLPGRRRDRSGGVVTPIPVTHRVLTPAGSAIPVVLHAVGIQALAVAVRPDVRVELVGLALLLDLLLTQMPRRRCGAPRVHLEALGTGGLLVCLRPCLPGGRLGLRGLRLFVPKFFLAPLRRGAHLLRALPVRLLPDRKSVV